LLIKKTFLFLKLGLSLYYFLYNLLNYAHNIPSPSTTFFSISKPVNYHSLFNYFRINSYLTSTIIFVFFHLPYYFYTPKKISNKPLKLLQFLLLFHIFKIKKNIKIFLFLFLKKYIYIDLIKFENLYSFFLQILQFFNLFIYKV
jgi:hypothetical protein